MPWRYFTAYWRDSTLSVPVGCAIFGPLRWGSLRRACRSGNFASRCRFNRCSFGDGKYKVVKQQLVCSSANATDGPKKISQSPPPCAAKISPLISLNVGCPSNANSQGPARLP